MSTDRMAADDVVKAAMSVARDAAEGRLDPADLDAEIADTCRELMGTVTGPDHPCWAVQLDVCRAVLAAGGLPVDELAEWLSVARSRVGATETPTDA
ncbi:MAG: flagellar hook-length control protein [Mycobacterium sp.]|nr:MAG: flagellar hook-length control protein [Mycobacterium sp.]